MTQARFIAFEGGEASGKSTQARLLAHELGAVLTREPGGTAVGERLRSLMLDPAAELADRTEALLMAAARAQHVAEIVRPALRSGHHVVTDRYIGSSLAYQGFGRGLPVDQIRFLSDWATESAWPDLVVLLEVADTVAASRLDPAALDRFERAGADFHRRVGEGFHRLAASENWLVVDGDRPVEVIAAEVRAAVRDRLGL